MKVGVITIHDLTNYGNRLQNYAMVKYLCEQGIDAESVVTTRYSESTNLKVILKKCFYSVAKLLKIRACASAVRKQNILSFENKYIPTRKVHTTQPYIYPKSIADEYDYFIVGSDQVWNLNWVTKDSPYFDAFMLKFAKQEQRIAYAASIGSDSLPPAEKAEFIQSLKEFKAVSIRESALKYTLNKETGKDIYVLLDPTMLFSGEEWRQNCCSQIRETHIRNKYALLYFLGKKTNELHKDIQNLKMKGYEIIDMFDKSQFDIYTASPEKFLVLIDDADIILTDSFHATVFSILFEKCFKVYERYEDNGIPMGTRIPQLLSMVGLVNRSGWDILCTEMWNVDYKHALSVLTEQRKFSRDYILHYLGITRWLHEN